MSVHQSGIVTALLAISVMACGRPSVDTDALSAELDRLASDHPSATVAVSIRDPWTGLEFDRLGDRSFHAASTMKVPVMIEVYRRARRGEIRLDDQVRIDNRFASIVDGSEYAISDDSDDALYEQLGASLTVRELVERMITVSSNLATNLLIELVDADSVQATSERLGTRAMQTLRGVEDLKAFEAGLSNSTNSTDLATLMHAIMEGRAVGPSEDSEMNEFLLDQQFNEMVPALLPPDVRVAHKTGQITRIHHDAAIVYPEGGNPYVLVILIEGIDDDTVSARLGARVASAVHYRLRSSTSS